MLIRKRAASLLLIIFLSSNAFAQRIVPVVDVSGGGCVMGGVHNGKWVEDDVMERLLKGGERYQIYSLTRKVGERIGKKPVSEGAPCTETMYVNDLYPKENQPDLIAVGGRWNALPRVPKVESTTSPVYRDAVATLLRRKRIRNPEVKIVKVLRVDLEGDGTEEVLINATRVQRWESGSISASSDAGDYSIVFLRKLVRGRVQTIVIEEEYHPKAGRQEDEGPPVEYTLTSVLDLNGDGRMEVIVEGGYYEGDWKTAYSITGRKAVALFGCGCGA